MRLPRLPGADEHSALADGRRLLELPHVDAAVLADELRRLRLELRREAAFEEIGRLDHVFKDQVDVAEAQILQETPHAIEVLLVPRQGWSKASERRLMKEFRARLGDVIDVKLETVSAIPREPNGKFRAVKSRVGRLRR